MEEINFWRDIQPTLSTIIGGFISYKIARMTIFPKTNIPILKKQLYSVYLPLFKALYKNLFHNRTNEEISKVLSLVGKTISEHYELVDPEIIYRYDNCLDLLEKINTGEIIYFDGKYEHNRQSILNYNFEKIEIIVSTKFDSTRSKLGLPTRSFKFKFQKKQLTPLWNNMVETVFKIILAIMLLILIILLTSLTIDLLTSIYESLARFTKMIFSVIS